MPRRDIILNKYRRVRRIVQVIRHIDQFDSQFAYLNDRIDKLEARPRDLIEMDTVPQDPIPPVFVPANVLFRPVSQQLLLDSSLDKRSPEADFLPGTSTQVGTPDRFIYSSFQGN